MAGIEIFTGFWALVVGSIAGVYARGADPANGAIVSEQFGTTADGRSVDIFTLTNSSGTEARIATFGGALVSLRVPDRNGELGDVVLGFDNLADYEKHRMFLGALIGRCANRIAKGRFSLNGKEYSLAVNNGENHLHGGIAGFDRVVWLAEPSTNGDAAVLDLTYVSPDGEEGYPGNVTVNVSYSLNDANELKIEYRARTDADTIVNLTNHSYFNLASDGDILGHHLRLNAARFTPADPTQIPTGEIRDVEDTPFDFTELVEIGSRINNDDEQLVIGGGYDHNWVLNKSDVELSTAAEVFEPVSGRVMEVLTTEPGLQFYSGNFLNGSVTGKDGRCYTHRAAFCLEAQHFPDSPNHPSFPSVVLRAGEEYKQTTIYRFSAK